MKHFRLSSPLARFFPILTWLPNYQRDWLRADLIAGLTVWAVMIPQAMAYAGIAGVPPLIGLYTVPFFVRTLGNFSVNGCRARLSDSFNFWCDGIGFSCVGLSRLFGVDFGDGCHSGLLFSALWQFKNGLGRRLYPNTCNEGICPRLSLGNYCGANS